MNQLAKNDAVMINGGEVIVVKDLREIIGGLPIYDITVSFIKENKPAMRFHDMAEFVDYCIEPHADGIIPFCLTSGQFPEDGYLINNEDGEMFSNKKELEDYLTDVYGSLKVEFDNFDGMTYYKEVENIEFEAGHKEEVFEEDDRLWRKLDITFVDRYDFISKNIIDDEIG